MAIVAVDKVPNCPNWDTNQKEILPETEKNEKRMNWKKENKDDERITLKENTTSSKQL